MTQQTPDLTHSCQIRRSQEMVQNKRPNNKSDNIFKKAKHFNFYQQILSMLFSQFFSHLASDLAFKRSQAASFPGLTRGDRTALFPSLPVPAIHPSILTSDGRTSSIHLHWKKKEKKFHHVKKRLYSWRLLLSTKKGLEWQNGEKEEREREESEKQFGSHSANPPRSPPSRRDN